MRSILPGRPQSSRQALSTVNWDGLRVVAYISGTTIIVFNGRREILQSISVDDADSLLTVSVEEGSGHIAACDKNTVYTYQPIGRDYGDLRWTRSQTLLIKNETSITYLSWGSHNELLVAGHHVTLWSFADDNRPQAIWSSDASSEILIASVSPDAALIASCGHHDRIVKIWRRLSYEQDSTRFDVSYLPHPSTVTNLTWRKSWHQEQNLDNLLYTFGADNHVRVWAHSDHHAYTTLQKIITIDTNISIQPRRLSAGSVSKSRFSFILESRDLARATERALQTARGTDHALEHLVEIANRSPEVCIILDDRGHMSAWGIENAGLKNKLQPDRFNLALVDGVDIALPSQRGLDDFAQIYAFANNDVSASLCILVHLHSGQIDWYQGSFVEFFDTAARPQRTRLKSCWSGHDATIERMIPAVDGPRFLSMTEQDHVILWSMSDTGALKKTSEWQSDISIIDAVLLSDGQFVFLLHADTYSLWDSRGAKARLISKVPLGRQDAKSARLSRISHQRDRHCEVLLLFEGNEVIPYTISLSSRNAPQEVNGCRQNSSGQRRYQLRDMKPNACIEFCSLPMHNTSTHFPLLFSWSDSGTVQLYDLSAHLAGSEALPSATMNLNIQPSISASVNGTKFLALVHADHRTVSIWNLEQMSYEYMHRLEDLDDVLELHWYTAENGLAMLAVQFTFHIAIIGQTRYTPVSGAPAWEMLQITTTRQYSSHVISSLSWIDSCQFAVGLGNQIVTFDVEERHNQPEGSNGTLPSKAVTAGAEYLRFQNSSVPLFSPLALGCWLEAGDVSAALLTFKELHRELKFATSGEYITLEEAAAFRVVTDAQSTCMYDGQLDNVNGRFELEEIQDQLSEHINKISPHQLTNAQKAESRSMLEITAQLLQIRKSIDPPALTYLYHFLRAMKSLESPNSPIPDLPYSAIVYATLSQTQEALLHFLLAYLEERDMKLTWPTARALGLFLFVSNPQTLKTHFESVARSEYNHDRDDRNPISCSLFYLALDKKAILQSLWRRTVGVKEKDATMKLLAHDFTEEKWKATALKNAYALLSRRRFEYAAAFFLLGGSLHDAVNVCVNQLHDIQLAVAVTRVWDRSPEQRDKVISNLLQKTIIELAIDSTQARWMAIWTCIYIQDFAKAMRFIVQSTDVLFDAQIRARRESGLDAGTKNEPPKAQSYHANEPTLLLDLYKYLRSELVAQHRWTSDAVTPREEWVFVMRCVNWYSRAGLDWHALQTVINWEFLNRQVPRKEMAQSAAGSIAAADSGLKSVLDEWLGPADTVELKVIKEEEKGREKTKPKPTQFVEPSADSLLDSFGF